jgi:hypothetical protein
MWIERLVVAYMLCWVVGMPIYTCWRHPTISKADAISMGAVGGFGVGGLSLLCIAALLFLFGVIG